MRYITIDYDQQNRIYTIWTSDHKVFCLNGEVNRVSEQIRNFVIVEWIDKETNKIIKQEQIWNVYVDIAGGGTDIFLKLKDIGIDCNKVEDCYEYIFSSQKPQQIII